jgi:hypothetical protein
LQHPEIDLESLVRQGCELIRSRRFYETRNSGEEDDGLCGLLGMLQAIVKYNPHFKESADGKVCIPMIF